MLASDYVAFGAPACMADGTANVTSLLEHGAHDAAAVKTCSKHRLPQDLRGHTSNVIAKPCYCALTAGCVLVGFSKG